MPNVYKSLYEGSTAAEFTRNKARFQYEPFTLLYKLTSKKARCVNCGSSEVVVEHVYIPDFVSEDGEIIVETKGKFTEEMRTKMLAVIRDNPHLDIRILFMRDNWLTRKKLKKYSDWARQKGVTYAVGELPKTWISDFKKHHVRKQRQIGGNKVRGIGQ